MDEAEIQRKRRDNEEEATRRRAGILGLPYLDTRTFEETVPLVPDVLSIEDMRKDYIVPLQVNPDEASYRFMVTSQTPNSLIPKMRQEYTDRGAHIAFFLISKAAYQVFMLRYDPPKETVYDDIKIATEGDSETIAEVSRTLNTVSTEKVFNFLIDQADRLNASAIFSSS